MPKMPGPKEFSIEWVARDVFDGLKAGSLQI
jgi:hypothetical protein